MAMQKDKTSGSGAVSTYHKITRVTIENNRSGAVQLSSYINSTCKDQGKEPLERKVYRLPPSSFSTAALNESTPAAIGYSFIKATEEFFSTGVNDV